MDRIDPAALAGPDRVRDLTVNRTRLRVWEWGDPAAPPVICVHGAHDHGRMWDELAPALAALGFHVIAIDVRGHGSSGRLASGHVWNVATMDLAAVAREAGRPVGLIGHSFGGGQVLSTAAAWPELVTWAVNIDGLGPPEEAFEEIPLVDAATRSLANIERQLGGARPFDSLQALVERRAAVNVRLPRAWVEHLVRHGHHERDGSVAFATDPLFNAGIPDDFSAAHAVATFPDVTVPTLVLTGSEPDTWSDLGPDEVRRRVALLPDAEHREIPEAGHYVHLEQPGAVLDAIADFVERRGRRAPAGPSADRHAPRGPGAPTENGATSDQVTPAAAPAPRAGGDTVPVEAIPAPALDDPTPRLVVLHDLGLHDDGASWRAAGDRWPGRLDAPDLPGHNGAPAPVGGHYEAGDVPFFVTRLFPATAVHRPIVAGVGATGWSALVLALAGRAEGVVVVDGLGGPWVGPREAAKRTTEWRRAILSDPTATRPHGADGTDPRLRHRPTWVLGEGLLRRAIAELSIPVLILETPASSTPPGDAERVGGDHLRRLSTRAPEAVLDAIHGWAAATEQLRTAPR